MTVSHNDESIALLSEPLDVACGRERGLFGPSTSSLPTLPRYRLAPELTDVEYLQLCARYGHNDQKVRSDVVCETLPVNSATMNDAGTLFKSRPEDNLRAWVGARTLNQSSQYAQHFWSITCYVIHRTLRTLALLPGIRGQRAMTRMQPGSEARMLKKCRVLRWSLQKRNPRVRSATQYSLSSSLSLSLFLRHHTKRLLWPSLSQSNSA